MNIAQVIADAIRGRAPRPHEPQRGGLDFSPPADFLRREVWPLLKQARAALEARDYVAVALQPLPEDGSHSYTLLILDSSCRTVEEACFLRFLVHDQQLHIRVKNQKRNDESPVPLHPPGSTLMVKDIIEDFVFHCVTPREPARHALPQGEPGCAQKEPLNGLPHLTPAHEAHR